jgi:hypothetical protein
LPRPSPWLACNRRDLVPEPRFRVAVAVLQEVQDPVPLKFTVPRLAPLTSSAPLRLLAPPLA